jgi:hypothetical protein
MKWFLTKIKTTINVNKSIFVMFIIELALLNGKTT